MRQIPQLSVIAPYAGDDTLEYFIAFIAAQTLEPDLFELLLISDGNYECARLLAQSSLPFRARVIPLDRPNGFTGHSAGLCRNLGARFAQGRILVFIDSDCLPHPNCLQAHHDLLAGDERLAVGGAARELPVYNKELLQTTGVRYEEISASSLPDYRADPAADDITPSTGDGWDDWYSVNASVLRADFLAVGGFSELGYRCHDLDLAYRLFRSGVRFAYSPYTEVVHVEHPRSISFRRQQIKGLLQLERQHPELGSFVEDRVIVYQRLFMKTVERCEQQFQKLTRNLPGVRIGWIWALPPGTPDEAIAPHLDYIPYSLKEHGETNYISLRLHKNCWDYSLLLPRTTGLEPPLISVVITTHNSEDNVHRAIKSVLLQTCQQFELIIIDDASADGTLQSIHQYQADPRFRFFSLRHNQGLSNALNAGLQQCRAPFLVQLDADDWLEESALETILRALNSDDSIGALYGDAIVHDRDEVSIPKGRQLNSAVEFLECRVPQVPRAFRKTAVQAVGGWSTSDPFFGRYFDDRLILAKIAEKYRVAWIPQNLYHIEELPTSLSRGVPLNFMAGKLIVLWDQANQRGLSLSYSFNGRYLRPSFQPRSAEPLRLSWSVIIPFHRSIEQLTICVNAWLESDLLTTNGEIIVVDDASGEDLASIVELDPQRISVIHSDAPKGAAWARNAGAARARHEMLFFCDADQIVPPDVLRCHEQRHSSSRTEALVVGSVFGRRTFSTVAPDCRPLHKTRLLDLLRFDDRFEAVAARLACGQPITFIDSNTKQIWKTAAKTAIADPWYGDWAKLFLRYGDGLQDYKHRWTRVNSGNLSIRPTTFRNLGGFDEYLPSMEDWELGARAQKLDIQIVSAPEAEPYHLIHPVDPSRTANDQIAASIIRMKHGDLVKDLLALNEYPPPPAARSLKDSLLGRNGTAVKEPSPTYLHDEPKGGYCALTFDDGPHLLGTPMILETLKRFNFKATFFVLGSEVHKYSDICREAVRLGHEIGTHGWVHQAVEQLTTAENLEFLKKSVDVINQKVGVDVRYVRPPYGRHNVSFANAAQTLGLEVVGWDLSSDDWLALSKRDIAKSLAADGIANKVILFHDGAGDPTITVEALEWLLETCVTYGISPVSLEEYSTRRPLPSLKPMETHRWLTSC